MMRIIKEAELPSSLEDVIDVNFMKESAVKAQKEHDEAACQEINEMLNSCLRTAHLEYALPRAANKSARISSVLDQ